ncbi:MAG: imidazoleglycerol-phosphate dehydratase HisB [Coriobacteriia bacterium]|nr:imidazoleglycerol-phosphate dehydratase HisB [Coriobacteriia bacterium]
MARIAEITRTTKETDITVRLDLDGTGTTDVSTGVPFFDHMLDAFGRHGLFDLTVRCVGDVQVDAHHTVEDCGIVLGQALKQAIGEKRGIVRYGSSLLPMDETLVMAALDFSGRGGCWCDLDIPAQKVGDFDTELAQEFFVAFAQNAEITLHVRQMAGRNSHHILEAAFKAVTRALKEAVAIDPRIADQIPSTKGAL